MFHGVLNTPLRSYRTPEDIKNIKFSDAYVCKAVGIIKDKIQVNIHQI